MLKGQKLAMDPTNDGLAPYRQCPMGEPHSCNFGDALEEAPNIPGPGVFAARVHRCGRCGHGVTRPAIADVSVLYEGRNSQDYQRGDGRFARMVKTFAFDRQARALLRSVGGSPRTIVDFACGSGLFTSRVAAAAPKGARVFALDFFDEAPGDMPGVEYLSFKHLAEMKDRADLLLCFHALEHDDDPDAFLGRLLPLLKSGGSVVIEVPNGRCAWASIFGRHWDNWYVPYHRLHFSRESLRGLLRRHGLTIEREIDICAPSMGRSLARLLRRRQTLPIFALGIALHPLQWLVERVSGQPSALRVIARGS